MLSELAYLESEGVEEKHRIMSDWFFKEFAPANWFGHTFWRTTLTRQYGLELPFTHHPEPARALDALLVGAVGVIWFLWVRRLAVERHHRTFLAWALFAAGGIVAIVSFAPWPGSRK